MERLGPKVRLRLWLSVFLRQRMSRDSPPQVLANAGRCSLQVRLSLSGRSSCFLFFLYIPNAPKQALRGEAPASLRRLFSTDHLGKARYKLNGQNARLVKC